jgi:L-ribulokinase
MRHAAACRNGHEIDALAIDTTGSSVIPADKELNPLDDYYLWCDRRAWRQAAEITETADLKRSCSTIQSAKIASS